MSSLVVVHKLIYRAVQHLHYNLMLISSVSLINTCVSPSIFANIRALLLSFQHLSPLLSACSLTRSHISVHTSSLTPPTPTTDPRLRCACGALPRGQAVLSIQRHLLQTARSGILRVHSYIKSLSPPRCQSTHLPVIQEQMWA